MRLDKRNVASYIQPMYAGIIRSLKLHYRRYLTNHFMELLDNDLPKSANGRQALHFVSQAWCHVKPQTICNIWGRVRIIPSTTEHGYSDIYDPEDDRP